MTVFQECILKHCHRSKARVTLPGTLHTYEEHIKRAWYIDMRLLLTEMTIKIRHQAKMEAQDKPQIKIK